MIHNLPVHVCEHAAGHQIALVSDLCIKTDIIHTHGLPAGSIIPVNPVFHFRLLNYEIVLHT